MLNVEKAKLEEIRGLIPGLGGPTIMEIAGSDSVALHAVVPHERVYQLINMLKRSGARNLHVVNLDGAFSTSSENVQVIRDVVAETDVFVQVGGGIRSIADARDWLNAGVDRIIVSTFATKEPKALTALTDEFGSERIMADVDARAGEIAVSG